MSRLVLTEIQDGVLKVCLNRPRAANAINLTMLAELRRHFESAADDTRVVVALLTASGADFSCGIDVPEAFGMSTPTAEQLKFVPDVQSWREFPKLKVCAVEGAVKGLGLSLVEASDVCVSGTGAMFQHDEVSLGLCPSGGSTQLLPRLVGIRLATDMLLSGLALDANQARHCGLITRVVPHGKALEEAEHLARALSRLSQPLTTEVRRLLQLSGDTPLQDGTADELRTFRRTFALADRLEGTAAALQRRTPSFRHC